MTVKTAKPEKKNTKVSTVTKTTKVVKDNNTTEVKESKPVKLTKTGRVKISKEQQREKAELKRQALICGLNLTEYRIVKVINEAGAEGITYKGIGDKTGMYTVLSQHLKKQGTRRDYGDNLANKGIVKENIIDVKGHDVSFFVLTPKGKKLLEKLNKKAN